MTLGPNTKASQPLTVLLCADQKYAAPLTTTLASILLHHPKEEPIKIIIGTLKESPLILNDLLPALSKLPINLELLSEIEVISLDVILSPEVVSKLHFPKSIFLRIELLEVLADRFGRLLYLDSDMLVRTSLMTLWRLPNSQPMKAVPDILEKSYLERVGFDKIRTSDALSLPKNYFNSGLCLVDLLDWKNKRRYKKCRQLMETNLFPLPDQDILNLVYGDNVDLLDSVWNWQWASEGSRVARLMNPFLELYSSENVAVVHFFGRNKPWFTDTQGPFYKEYQALYCKLGFKLKPALKPNSRNLQRILEWRGNLILQLLNLRLRVQSQKSGLEKVIFYCTFSLMLASLLNFSAFLQRPSKEWQLWNK